MHTRPRWATAAIMLPLACCIVFQVLLSWPAPNRRTLDLDALWASGYAYRQGLSPYTDPNTIVSTDGPLGPNANPPLFLLIFVPLSYLNGDGAYRLMHHLSLALYILCVIFLTVCASRRPRARQVAWALAMAAPWYTIQYGQVYILLLPLAVGAWWCLAGERYVAAGVLLGVLAALKPNYALWPALLLLSGYRVTGLAAGMVTVALSALALLLFGPSAYQEWLAVGRGFAEVSRILPIDMSLFTLAARFGLPSWAAYPLAAALLAVAAWLAWRLRPPAHAVSALAIATALVASPRAWLGYAVLLLPLFLTRPWSWPLRIAAGLLLAPASVVWIIAEHSAAASVAVGCLYPLAALLLLVHCIRSVVMPRPAPEDAQGCPWPIFAGATRSQKAGAIRQARGMR